MNSLSSSTSQTSLSLSPSSADEKRSPEKRIFVNRSLALEKIKFYGFDMDYTLAEYKSPEYDFLGFELVKERLIEIGYPKEIQKFEFKPEFPVRGLWWDNLHGNMLKVDGFGNILYCCHGLKFMKPEDISVKYPNKFIKLEEKRIFVYNTLFNLPEIYLLACLIDFFQTHKDYKEVKDGFNQSDLHMSYKSLFQDVRTSVDYVHMHGDLKPKTCQDLPRYIKKDGRLPTVLYNLHKSGAKTFFLTNSDWDYSNKVMEYLMDCPGAPHQGKSWQSYFDFTFVDARKPRFFDEGTLLRQVDKSTGQLSIGTHTGNLEGSAVYSGGNSEIISKLMGAKGRDVLYVGDHIFGDVLKSKKLRGWRTFLIVPELDEELHVWTSKQQLYSNLQSYDHQLAKHYKDMDSGNTDRPNVAAIKSKIQETIHSMEMAYGTGGSLFRSGSRQTFFSAQVLRYADIYAASVNNLLYYPTCYMFRSPPTLLPHESTVHQDYGHSHHMETADIRDKNGISSGQEPSHTHDMDDDDIDIEENDSSSEQSN